VGYAGFSAKETTMNPTKNTLNSKVRAESSRVLQDRLSNGIDLLLRTKQAHWNVKGPNFIALHEFFDELNETTEEWVDLIAERIMQLGGSAVGTLQSTAKRSQLPEYPLDISEGHEHVQAVAESLAYFGELVRTASDDIDRIGDRDSSDIFTQISRAVDKRGFRSGSDLILTRVFLFHCSSMVVINYE
jgi:starvation-inducible DNA-binding protein